MSATLAHLTDAQRELLAETEALASSALAPLAHQTPGRVNLALLGALAQHGLLGRLFAGEDVQAMELCLIREALARHCTEAETAFAVQGLGAHPILRNGGAEVLERWIGPLAAGEVAAGFALTEPDAGSDVAGLTLAAERDGDGWRLTGEKTYISNAPDADGLLGLRAHDGGSGCARADGLRGAERQRRVLRRADRAGGAAPDRATDLRRRVRPGLRPAR